MVMPFYRRHHAAGSAADDGRAADEAWLKQLLAPLIDALATLHAAHCYHRDIAPDNILLLGRRRPLLLDFGAARRVIGDITQALTVILKPGFAPIEQYAEGPSMKQGPWTDIYALAAVVYFAITGSAPAPAVARMMSDPLKAARRNRASTLQRAVPGGIDRALAVKPEDRPQTIAEFARVLDLGADRGMMSTSWREPSRSA